MESEIPRNEFCDLLHPHCQSLSLAIESHGFNLKSYICAWTPFCSCMRFMKNYGRTLLKSRSRLSESHDRCTILQKIAQASLLCDLWLDRQYKCDKRICASLQTLQRCWAQLRRLLANKECRTGQEGSVFVPGNNHHWQRYPMAGTNVVQYFIYVCMLVLKPVLQTTPIA